MKLRYRVFKDFNPAEVQKLKVLGISVEQGFDAFLIDADYADLAVVKDIIGEEWETTITHEIEFSEMDRRNASYLHVYPNKLFGYPQPESGKDKFPFDQYPYFKDVFEIEKTDPEYGVLKGKQIGKFRFKKEPNWGSSSIGSAFWIQDSIFVKPEIYKRVFEPLGIKAISVLEYKTKKELNTVLQLLPQGISNANLEIKNDHINEIQTVESWGIKKYILKETGFYPDFKSAPGDFDFFESKEYFGAGGFTVHSTIISQKLYQLLVQNNVRGLNYEPMSI